jgi:type IV secretion system protein VirD4
VSLPDLALALSDPRRPIDELYAEMIENTHDVTGLYVADYPEVIKHAGQHPVVAAGAAAMLNRPDDERGSVLSTAQSFLALYADPIVAKNTRHSDFTISDLMNSKTPVTLYLAAREEDKDRLKPLMRLIINQIVRILLRPELRYAEGRPVVPHVHRLLLMLDEFPSYGKLEVFEEALSYLAGYGIKAYLIMQDVEQLYKAYGENESLTSNCHIRVAYAPNKLKTAQWLSLMTGKMTVNTEEYAESGKRFGARLDSISRTWKATERELLTADEVMRLKSTDKDENGSITAPGNLLVFAAGQAPIYGTQSLYFRDPVFVARVKNPPPTQADSAKSETSSLSTRSPRRPAGESVPAKAIFILKETPQQDTALRGLP